MEAKQNLLSKILANKILKVILIIFAVLVLLFVIVFAYNFWRISTGRLIKWEGQYYTQKQIKEKYGDQVYNVPSKNTPEEVYKTFRDALLKNDIEGALGQIREEKREGYREAFVDKVKFEKWVKTLPVDIKNVRIDGNFGYYDWNKGDGYRHSIDFLKNKDGYWQIDGI